MLLDAHNHSAVDERLIVVPGTRLLPSTSIIATISEYAASSTVRPHVATSCFLTAMT